MKKILLIGTGGTVTAKTTADNAWKPGGHTERDILEFIPEIEHIITGIETMDLFRLDSTNIQPHHWIELARVIYNNLGNKEKFDGIVVTHGTDTMHYTASALSFMLQPPLPVPVVLTGSQVPPHMIGSDARRNLLDSVRVASETDVGEVVIVFDSRILRGNRAKKFRELEFGAFESVGMPSLGVVEHDIRLTGDHYNKARNNKKIKLTDKIEDRVCLLKIYPGFDPEDHR